MKRILFLKNRIDVPGRYNFALNYGWVQRGIDAGLYEAYDWYIDDIPTVERLNDYLEAYEIDCIISMCANEARFAHLGAGKWHDHILFGVTVPTFLRAGDSCYDSWNDPFYGVWDHVFYRMPDKNGCHPVDGTFIPWCIDITKYTPKWGGEQLVMVGACNEAYPLRMSLRELNRQHDGALFLDMCNLSGALHGEKYIEALQNARAIITTGSKLSPETRGKVLEAAACGTLIITPSTKYLERYFNDDQVFVFNTGAEFIEVCKRVRQMPMDAVIAKQKAVYEHVSQNHNCIKFINNHILPAIDAATRGQHGRNKRAYLFTR